MTTHTHASVDNMAILDSSEHKAVTTPHMTGPTGQVPPQDSPPAPSEGESSQITPGPGS